MFTEIFVTHTGKEWVTLNKGLKVENGNLTMQILIKNSLNALKCIKKCFKIILQFFFIYLLIQITLNFLKKDTQ